ncbi:hypothetical protein L1049_016230 [Liquidambar formosana]|uniref:Pectinesterase inhibitor domain-containing protein n=1 Tax=Liquidambar formosana TaxID=63359 RepID=A0AAP0RYY3_LIQFO
MQSFTCSKLPPHNGLGAIITLFLFSFFTSVTITCSAKPHLKSSNTEFIKTSCAETLYPELCYKTLKPYASLIHTSPMELANASLTISLKGAQSASNMVKNLSKQHNLSPKEASAIMDCVETMGDSVDDLQQSLVAMEGLDGPDFAIKMSDIQTWVSAALTNEDTCMDGFSREKGMNRKIKVIIRRYIVKVSKLTSIALAFINRLSSA